MVKRIFKSLQRALRFPSSGRIVLGSANVPVSGWLLTDKEDLDVTRRESFLRYWKPGTRSAFLAEHVWEHLTEEEGKKGIANCFEFLKKGGRLRIAVPDGFHPDPEYRNHVRPGGSGPGADDHKLLYNYRLLESMMKDAGFNPVLLEYWDENGKFHYAEWSPEDGYVARSKRYDKRNQDGTLRYTSLIIDGLKP